jgi:hypothetical protein
MRPEVRVHTQPAFESRRTLVPEIQIGDLAEGGLGAGAGTFVNRRAAAGFLLRPSASSPACLERSESGGRLLPGHRGRYPGRRKRQVSRIVASLYVGLLQGTASYAVPNVKVRRNPIRLAFREKMNIVKMS